MPNWKKLITSGADASLSSLSLTGISGQNSEETSLMINGDGEIGTRELGSLAFSSATYNNYSLPLGSSSTRGGFKIGYTESGKNYPVEISSEKMYVNVPWTDTNTQATRADLNLDTDDSPVFAGLTLSGVANPQLNFNGSSDTGVDMAIKATPEGLDFFEPEDTNKVHFQIKDDTGVSSTFGYQVNGTSVISSGRKLENVNGNISMFTNDSGYKTTDTQRTDKEIEDVIEKNVNPVVSATVSNDTTTFTKQDGTTFALTTSDANNNTVTSIRKDNAGTYRTGNINLVGGDNVTIAEKASGEFTISSTDTNTDTNTQRSDEEIRDVAAAQWINGTNTTVVKSDSGNTIKINSVNTTYQVRDGELSQKNFTTALKDKLDAIPFVQDNDNIDIGTETIMSVYTSPWNAVFFDYVVMKAGNMRAGTVTAVNDGTNVEFIETSTADLGDTSDVKLFCDIDTDSMRFRATVKSNDWKVKVLPRMI